MKFKKIHSLSAALAVTISALGVGTYVANGMPTAETAPKRIVRTPAKQEYRIEPLKYRIDTIPVTDENYAHVVNRVPAGLFLPDKNTVTVSYFKPESQSEKVQNFCNWNNRAMQLTARHEKEHARKMRFTHLERHRSSPFVRGEIALVNEIMAPAAEIIEAIDYHYKTGEVFPSAKSQPRQADAAISALPSTMNYMFPVDFNNPAVADIVLEYALAQFKRFFNAGWYHSSVANAAKNKARLALPMNNTCLTVEAGIFMPDAGFWDPMWSFESLRGPVNLWRSASPAMRKKLMREIETMTAQAIRESGQILMCVQKTKTR